MSRSLRQSSALLACVRVRRAPATLLTASRPAFSTKRYSADHEWVSVSNGIGTIGITDYAQKALGDVVFIELPSVGTVLQKKDNLGAVESVKAASDIYAPVSGEVVEVNASVSEEPSLINSSPEENAWIAKIKLSKPEELDLLLDEARYVKHCEDS